VVKSFGLSERREFLRAKKDDRLNVQCVKKVKGEIGHFFTTFYTQSRAHIVSSRVRHVMVVHLLVCHTFLTLTSIVTQLVCSSRNVNFLSVHQD